MLYIDVKYLNLISYKLERFKQKSKTSWNFRCPFCGDSQKSQHKARGNVFENGQSLIFKCFNCQHSCSISSLIQHVNPALYKEYLFESFGDKKEVTDFVFKKEVINNYRDSILDGITCITDLEHNHKAYQYIISRQIPEKYYSKIYYTDDFMSWVHSIIPDKFENVYKEERIIFPYFDKHGKCFVVNARSLNEYSKSKYIIIKFDESKEVIYGLDDIDYSKHIYITEGQIDSMFLPNSLAVSGANFDIDTIQKIKTNCTLIFDNEPRNKQVCTLIYKQIQNNYNICIWPKTFKYKDINDAILGGMSKDQILDVINKNTYNGLTAELVYGNWKKVS